MPAPGEPASVGACPEFGLFNPYPREFKD